MCRPLTYLLSIILLFSVLFSSANGSEKSAPYISKLPRDGLLRMVVMGDSLADGLHQGLTQLNKDRDFIKTIRKSKVNTGLVRRDRFDWNKGAARFVRSGKYQVAVALLGLNDLQTIREGGKAHHFKTGGWIERYISRVEKMMADLKASGVATYWVGIPIVTEDHYQEEYKYLNGLFQAAAQKMGVRYVDTWTPLTGVDGQYTPFHKDKLGKTSEIRMRDGVHFTPDGYLIFASFVNDIIFKDLQAAGFKALEPIPATE